MKASRLILYATLLVAAGSFTILTLFVFYHLVTMTDGSPDMLAAGDKVGLVRVEGVLGDTEDALEQLQAYRKSGSVKAVVLRIDTPGGGVGASRELYEEVLRIREDGKPVVTSMGPLAASGGYYVACASDSILAGPSTITGSIGVVAVFANYTEALDKLGLKFHVLATGPFKASGLPVKEFTEEERAYLQSLLDDLYQQFVDVIAEARGLPRDTVLAVADGRAFTGRQAVDLGLVDRLGTLEDATTAAAILADLPVPPRVVEKKERRFSLRDLIRESRLFLRAAPAPFPRIEYRLY